MERTISFWNPWIKYLAVIITVWGIVFSASTAVQACIARNIAPNEVQVELGRPGSGVNLERVKAALGPGYFNKVKEGIVFRCVDGKACDILLTSKKISFRSHNSVSSVLTGDMVRQHLSWLKMIGASDIDATHIRRITEKVSAEKRDGGYFLAYGHDDRFYLAENCVDEVLGRNVVCAKDCVQKTLFPQPCDAVCARNIRQSRIDCDLACSPAVRECYEKKAEDDWAVLGRSHVVDEEGTINMVKCGGREDAMHPWPVPGKASNLSAETFVNE